MKHTPIYALLLSATLSIVALGSVAGQTTRTRAPANASAKCNDGTYSTAKNERGACSRHGGIAQWLGSAGGNANVSSEQSAPRGATARCTDGTYSKSTGQGVCSRHGGVSDWLSTPAPEQPAEVREAAPAAENRSTAAAAHQPEGATARCKDGSYSRSTHRSGTCSYHGGVAEWIHRPSEN